ncbi:MAG: glycosyltransferase [Chitinophagaceae bacterium]
MHRFKALWLCSWYPDRTQPQNGDFIQRHACAVSLFADVTTIHVTPCHPSKMGKKNVSIDARGDDTLTENVLYYKKRKNDIFYRMHSACQYFYQYRKWVRRHLQQSSRPDIVHVHVAWRDGLVALWLKKRYNIPYVLTEHWTLYHINNGRDFQQKNFFFKFFVKKILQNATVVLPVSSQLGNTLQSLVPSVQYKVVSNVVNTEVFNYREPATQQPFIFIHVSSFSNLKNPKGIIEAFGKTNQQFPFTKLVLIGETKNLNVETTHKNIELIDSISNDEVAAYMQQSHAFVLFSFAENQPCVLLEALCCGLPVISSDVGGISEFIGKDNGLLTEPGNIQMLTEKMHYMIKHYPLYNRKDISKKAIAQYNHHIVGKQIDNIYHQALSSRQQKARMTFN